MNVLHTSQIPKEIVVNSLSTPLGDMLAGVACDELCFLEFSEEPRLSRQLAKLKKHYPAEIIEGEHLLIDELQQQLAAYFKGTRKSFDMPLALFGTAFQQKIWRELLNVPYGVTRSYKQQAHQLGSTKAVRAVARTNSENRMAIVIPCHRIIGTDGSIVGYGGGIKRKQWLLQHEFENQ